MRIHLLIAASNAFLWQRSAHRQILASGVLLAGMLLTTTAAAQVAKDEASADGPQLQQEQPQHAQLNEANDAAQPADTNTQSTPVSSTEPTTGDGFTALASIAMSVERFPYYSTVELPPYDKAQSVCDFLVTPAVFDKARTDLGDLRLVDAAGHEVPYALRIRRPVQVDEQVAASEFNRAVGPNESAEVTLDLGQNPAEHNSLEVVLPGKNYRRAAHLEGSNDNEQWKTLVDKSSLMHFVSGNKEFDQRRVNYPPSRYRYLRLRVDRDPEVDERPVEVGAVTVHRKVEAPGEMVTLDAKLGQREPVSVNGNPGSAWMIDLGADNMPCQQLLVDVADAEFARDWQVQRANVPDEYPPFTWLAGNQWRRRAGDARTPMVADFPETTARSLRLEVVDFRNPPLDIRGVRFVAAAREVIFVRTEAMASPLRLYYGNLQAEPPHYDMERILPPQLVVPPLRVTLGERESNPDFQPAPLPLTERLPWLIYVVLGAASLALGLVIMNLGRTAIARHDGEPDAKT